MNEIVFLVLIVIFSALSLLHLYWALGGKSGSQHVIPTNAAGEVLFSPSPFMTAVVGLGLASLALFYLNYWQAWAACPPWLERLILWGIPSIFLIRAIGDFKYAGFFKRVKGSGFARMDSKIYSPLCFLVAILGYVLVYIM